MNQDTELAPNGFNQTCRGCGRAFAQPTAFSNHSSSCAPTKKRLANALVTAQELYREKKKRRLLGALTTPLQGSSSNSRTATNARVRASYIPCFKIVA
jgi:hypothetical protein